MPQSNKAAGYNLGNWVSIQRGKYAKGNLDPAASRRTACLDVDRDRLRRRVGGRTAPTSGVYRTPRRLARAAIVCCRRLQARLLGHGAAAQACQRDP
ncbi:MAG: helicase associated domain-containing protein [Mycobacterium sp.]|uniref:helicase associated domain-containing protein n=1 Tax=Mycobacterium sp. TaxID=1785 RepID=UPI003F950882